MFIIHINVINKVSEFRRQRVVSRLMKSKGSDEVRIIIIILNKCSINNISYDADYEFND